MNRTKKDIKDIKYDISCIKDNILNLKGKYFALDLLIRTKFDELMSNNTDEPKHAKSDEDEVLEMLNDMFKDIEHITIIKKDL